MKKAPRVLTVHYTLKNGEGKVLDSSVNEEPLTYMEGAEQIIPGLERALLLLGVGDKREVTVAAAEAYGERDEEMILDFPRSKIPADAKFEVGDMIQMNTPDGPQSFAVKAISEEVIQLDGNHPLAGEDLHFSVEIIAVREATKEEQSHGHAHGPGGHHHH